MVQAVKQDSQDLLKSLDETVQSWRAKYPEAGDDVPKWILPPRSCEFIAAIIQRMNEPCKAFEFGSGRSTHVLRANCVGVTSIEDSHEWLVKTEQIPDGCPKRSTDHTDVVPLTRCRMTARPFRSFDLMRHPAVLAKLRESSFILVDSPPNPATREHALQLALTSAPVNAVILLDDLDVGATARFARRLANRNRNAFRFWELRMDHGLGVFCKTKQTTRLNGVPTPREFVGSWLRA